MFIIDFFIVSCFCYFNVKKWLKEELPDVRILSCRVGARYTMCGGDVRTANYLAASHHNGQNRTVSIHESRVHTNANNGPRMRNQFHFSSLCLIR